VNSFIIPKKTTQIIVLQRIELLSPFFQKIRKLFGRFIFTNIISKYFLNHNSISKKYYEIMVDEFSSIKKFIEEHDVSILSIGGGIGGLELIINQNFKNKNYYFIEKNYISQKVVYGWGGMENKEAYNNLVLQKNFLKKNHMTENQINIFDFDKDKLPYIKFDLIISLLSLDYHYDFNLYIDYLKKVSTDKTKIIFDTIRAEYFKNIFKNVEIIRTDHNTVHKSKRIICSYFRN